MVRGARGHDVGGRLYGFVNLPGFVRRSHVGAHLARLMGACAEYLSLKRLVDECRALLD